MTEKIYTTGSVAKLCRVAPRTVSKWMDSGKLKGYRIPGSHDRRFLKADLVRFMEENNLPAEFSPDHVEEAIGFDRVLVVGGDPDAFSDTAGIEVTHVRSVFAAGIAFAEIKPTCVVVDLASVGRIDACLIAATIKGAGVIRLAIWTSAASPAAFVSFDGSITIHADQFANNTSLKYALYKARESQSREAS